MELPVSSLLWWLAGPLVYLVVSGFVYFWMLGYVRQQGSPFRVLFWVSILWPLWLMAALASLVFGLIRGSEDQSDA